MIALGGEVVQLHAIVVAEPPHEPPGGTVESPLVQTNEAHNVPRRGLRLLMPRRQDDPRWPVQVSVGRQLPVGNQPFKEVCIHIGATPQPDLLNHGKQRGEEERRGGGCEKAQAREARGRRRPTQCK
jgi:hypothetical protein